jgi:hypothetical protein
VRLNTTDGQITNLQITVVLTEIIRDIPASISEGYAFTRQIHYMQRICPAVAGPETHPGKHAQLLVGIDKS